jgi:hypothetical protein
MNNAKTSISQGSNFANRIQMSDARDCCIIGNNHPKSFQSMKEYNNTGVKTLPVRNKALERLGLGTLVDPVSRLASCSCAQTPLPLCDNAEVVP